MADDEDPRVRSKSRSKSPTEEVVQVNLPYIFHTDKKGGIKVLHLPGANKAHKKLNFDEIDKSLLNMQQKYGGTFFFIFDDDFAMSPDLDYVYHKTANNTKYEKYKRERVILKKYGIAISDEPEKNVFGYFFDKEINKMVKKYLIAVNNMYDIGNTEIVAFQD